MTKLPEEGEIWEWRAFGQVDAALAAAVRAYPIRSGIIDHESEDIYLFSAESDHNVKLRKSNGESVLKFKLLIKKAPRSIELYKESADLIFTFPVDFDRLAEAASLLRVRLPETLRVRAALTQEEFIRALARSSPPVAETLVSKTRSQFQADGGWIEMADVTFARCRAQSLSIQSTRIGAIERLLELLRPGPQLEAMNYVEACRRWG